MDTVPSELFLPPLPIGIGALDGTLPHCAKVEGGQQRAERQGDIVISAGPNNALVNFMKRQ